MFSLACINFQLGISFAFYSGLPVKPLVFVKTEETQPYNPSVDNTPVDHILIESEFEEKLKKDPKKSDTVEESNPGMNNFSYNTTNHISPHKV